MCRAPASPGLFLLLFGLAAGGCQPDVEQHDPDRAGRPRSEIFDSADIRIVVNARPPEGSRLGWRIGPKPSVSIGAADGEEPYLFNGAVSGARLPDGRIVVADGSSRELRIA